MGNEGHLNMDGEIWQTALRYVQEQVDPDNAESIGIAANIPTSGGERTQLNTDLLTQKPSMDELNNLDQIVQNATDLGRSLLVGTSSLDPTHDLDNQPQQTIPQCASFDTNLTGFNFNQGLPDGLLFMGSPRLQDDWFPSSLQLTRGCELFFAHVSPFVPFLHQPTFDVTQTPPLLALSMLCLAYQYGEDLESGYQAGSGVNLSTRCFHRARALISFSSDERPADGLTNNVMTVQSHLLLQICAMMYLCGEDSAYGLKIHSNMISLVRAGGMMAPATSASTTEDLESLWREFIKAESHKRTAFAVHQIDALWYQFLSIPRSISHLEIKHELPSSENFWTASSSVEWAHRQLIARDSGPSVQYTDAVRLFLSPDADLGSIPQFDPYGAINITQFLVSSAREISGWSAMTGMLSMDRFSALRSSLVALSRFIRPEQQQSVRAAMITTHAGVVSCAAEATWETAMIELHMWSPSHTGGIVEASIDAALNQLTTYLGPSCEILESNTAKAIQPHVNWFLRYLDMTATPDSEAPWIAFYAYKAFLIAWQLMHVKVTGAMQVIGVRDGDVEGALGWARKVFEPRRRWQLGRLIFSCLDELGK